jgi:hypothetical protein
VDLPAALRRAFAAVERGQSTVLDVIPHRSKARVKEPETTGLPTSGSRLPTSVRLPADCTSPRW